MVDYVENEIHFLIECKKYTLLRQELQRITVDPDFTLLSQFQKFIYLMSSDTPNIINSISLLIHNKSLVAHVWLFSADCLPDQLHM